MITESARWVDFGIPNTCSLLSVLRAVPALVSVSFRNGGYLNAGLMHKVSVVDNVPSMQMVMFQSAVSLNKGTAHTAVPVHFIFYLPLPFIMLNAQCFRA